MPRLRPFRRRAAERADDQEPEWNDESGDEVAAATIDYEAPIEPFVPVSAASYDEYDTEARAEAGAEPAQAGEPDAEYSRRRRSRLPRLRLPRPRVGQAFGVRLSVLLAALSLVAFGIFGTLLVQDRLRASVEEWWPLALVIVAGLWMLVALVRRQVASFLGGAGFAGVGLSLLLSAQEIAQVEETLLGVVLVTVGLGIVIRGFLLRRVPF